MFVEKECSLNESDSQAEYLCRQSMAKAGYAYGDAPVSFHWSQLVNPMGDKKAALLAYEELLKIEPENKSALRGVAFIYQTLGNSEQANVHRKLLVEIEARDFGIDLESQKDSVDFLLAKTGLAPQPDRAPSNYVGAHFDRYASLFDEQLCDVLNYRGHLFIEEICRDLFIAEPSQELMLEKKFKCALDIGCGTGLTGLSIHDLFFELEGVDLSDKMLEIAHERNVYTQLEKIDYQTHLSNNKLKYDVITASDVFIYEGDLTNTFKSIYEALNDNGHFIFTLEKGHTETYCLRNTGRFQHNENYIRDIAATMNFSVELVKEETIRIDEGQNVAAYVFLLKK